MRTNPRSGRRVRFLARRHHTVASGTRVPSRPCTARGARATQPPQPRSHRSNREATGTTAANQKQPHSHRAATATKRRSYHTASAEEGGAKTRSQSVEAQKVVRQVPAGLEASGPAGHKKLCGKCTFLCQGATALRTRCARRPSMPAAAELRVGAGHVSGACTGSLARWRALWGCT